VKAILEAQRAAFQRSPYPSAAERTEKLRALRSALRHRQHGLADAMAQDFGGRSRNESRLADVLGPVLQINHALRNLRRWMKPARRRAELLFFSNRVWVEYQPKGVVGIISPWNFPGFLTLGPLVAALAAGNRAMVKMSELVPASTQAMKELLAECFDADEVALMGGDAAVARSFASLPFDHLVFTGSTEVGRAVMRAASENLVPVTLELGGKSPAIVSRSADLDAAALRIVHGKVFNSGQICVSPDYALVPRELQGAFIQAAQAAFRRLAPRPSTDADYTSIVADRHAGRLLELLEDARALGATVLACGETANARRMPLHIVTGVTDAMRIAREEIFGPILPVLAYGTVEQAIEQVAARPRPLALYWFGADAQEAEVVRRHTHSGGVTLNDWCWHVFQHDLPFGGIGASGMGSYHGEEGFRALSHARAVFHERRAFPIRLFHPPYGGLAQRLVMRLFLGKL
jgi:coniferyl-aldehyde dehydrogenase